MADYGGSSILFYLQRFFWAQRLCVCKNPAELDMNSVMLLKKRLLIRSWCRLEVGHGCKLGVFFCWVLFLRNEGFIKHQFRTMLCWDELYGWANIKAETYFQPITTSNFDRKIQQHEFSCMLATAARDLLNGLRLDSASSGLWIIQLIQSVARSSHFLAAAFSCWIFDRARMVGRVSAKTPSPLSSFT